MNRSLLLAIAVLQLPAMATGPGQSAFSRFRRPVQVTTPGQVCTILDASTFSHSAPFLRDLRLYVSDEAGPREVPYVVTLSEAQQAESEPARVLNLAMRGRAISFDLAMPNRPYTEVILDLAGQDFLATASVSGADAPNSGHPAALGDFNLFDLTAQHLSRNTALHLQESTFPFLHVSLTVSPASGSKSFAADVHMVRGASVPPSREAQTLYTVAARTSAVETIGRRSLARLHLPERIPIERVSFVLSPGFRNNFSRDVLVSTHVDGSPAGSGDAVSGSIQRVKLIQGSRELREEQLSVPATLGANLQSPAEVEVAVVNGDDPPLPIAAVQLEMRQRALCFQALAGQHFTLFYGDSKLEAPLYDLARTYTPSARSATAQLGPEEQNPAWRPRPDERPYTERHPHLLWIALICVVCALALVAFRSTHPRSHRHHQHR